MNDDELMAMDFFSEESQPQQEIQPTVGQPQQQQEEQPITEDEVMGMNFFEEEEIPEVRIKTPSKAITEHEPTEIDLWNPTSLVGAFSSGVGEVVSDIVDGFTYINELGNSAKGSMVSTAYHLITGETNPDMDNILSDIKEDIPKFEDTEIKVAQNLNNLLGTNIPTKAQLHLFNQSEKPLDLEVAGFAGQLLGGSFLPVGALTKTLGGVAKGAAGIGATAGIEGLGQQGSWEKASQQALIGAAGGAAIGGAVKIGSSMLGNGGERILNTIEKNLQESKDWSSIRDTWAKSTAYGSWDKVPTFDKTVFAAAHDPSVGHQVLKNMYSDPKLKNAIVKYTDNAEDDLLRGLNEAEQATGGSLSKDIEHVTATGAETTVPRLGAMLDDRGFTDRSIWYNVGRAVASGDKLNVESALSVHKHMSSRVKARLIQGMDGEVIKPTPISEADFVDAVLHGAQEHMGNSKVGGVLSQDTSIIVQSLFRNRTGGVRSTSVDGAGDVKNLHPLDVWDMLENIKSTATNNNIKELSDHDYKAVKNSLIDVLDGLYPDKALGDTLKGLDKISQNMHQLAQQNPIKAMKTLDVKSPKDVNLVLQNLGDSSHSTYRSFMSNFTKEEQANIEVSRIKALLEKPIAGHSDDYRINLDEGVTPAGRTLASAQSNMQRINASNLVTKEGKDLYEVVRQVSASLGGKVATSRVHSVKIDGLKKRWFDRFIGGFQSDERAVVENTNYVVAQMLKSMKGSSGKGDTRVSYKAVADSSMNTPEGIASNSMIRKLNKTISMLSVNGEPKASTNVMNNLLMRGQVSPITLLTKEDRASLSLLDELARKAIKEGEGSNISDSTDKWVSSMVGATKGSQGMYVLQPNSGAISVAKEFVAPLVKPVAEVKKMFDGVDISKGRAIKQEFTDRPLSDLIDTTKLEGELARMNVDVKGIKVSVHPETVKPDDYDTLSNPTHIHIYKPSSSRASDIGNHINKEVTEHLQYAINMKLMHNSNATPYAFAQGLMRSHADQLSKLLPEHTRNTFTKLALGEKVELNELKIMIPQEAREGLGDYTLNQLAQNPSQSKALLKLAIKGHTNSTTTDKIIDELSIDRYLQVATGKENVELMKQLAFDKYGKEPESLAEFARKYADETNFLWRVKASAPAQPKGLTEGQ